MKTILLISPYWKEDHRWMVSSYKLADLWQRLGYRVIVACMGTQHSVEEVSPTLTIHYRKDFFLPDPWNYGIAFGFTGYVRKLIRQEHPDLIITNKILFWTSLSLIALRLTGHRVHLLTDALVGITWWPRGIVPRIGAFLYAWTLGWLIMLLSEKFVTFFQQPPHLLSRLCVREKTTVIPTGIDPSMYNTKKETRNTITITYIGRLESVKGVEDFLAAAVSVKKIHPSLHVQVVGWYKPNHPLVTAYESSVQFTGLRHDIPEVLHQSDIFVLPSFSEGLSNALMEAMSSSCACIASEVGGNRFLIQNGVSGFLFPAGDREALAAHIRRLIEDPVKRKNLGEAARKRIEDHFSWEKVGKLYEQFFDEALKQ